MEVTSRNKKNTIFRLYIKYKKCPKFRDGSMTSKNKRRFFSSIFKFDGICTHQAICKISIRLLVFACELVLIKYSLNKFEQMAITTATTTINPLQPINGISFLLLNKMFLMKFSMETMLSIFFISFFLFKSIWMKEENNHTHEISGFGVVSLYRNKSISFLCKFF